MTIDTKEPPPAHKPTRPNAQVIRSSGSCRGDEAAFKEACSTAQLGSLVFVIGSYTVARQLQFQKRRRHASYRAQLVELVELS
jgi:hypothetical protein